MPVELSLLNIILAKIHTPVDRSGLLTLEVYNGDLMDLGCQYNFISLRRAQQSTCVCGVAYLG